MHHKHHHKVQKEELLQSLPAQPDRDLLEAHSHLGHLEENLVNQEISRDWRKHFMLKLKSKKSRQFTVVSMNSIM